MRHPKRTGKHHQNQSRSDSREEDEAIEDDASSEDEFGDASDTGVDASTKDAVLCIRTEVFSEAVNIGLRAVGVSEAVIYAMNKTGLIILDSNAHRFPEMDLAEWNAAVMEYEMMVN